MTQFADRPNSIPWPPILFVGGIILALVLRWLAPLAMPFGVLLANIIGIVFAAGAAGLMLWTFAAFRAARTTIMPHHRSDALIETGPFAWSRNPIYLSEIVIFIGLAFALESPWLLLSAALFAFAVTRLAIIREEAHLKARFGAEWDTYAARVRRWL